MWNKISKNENQRGERSVIPIEFRGPPLVLGTDTGSISSFHHLIIKSIPSAASSTQLSRIFSRISLYFRALTGENASERLTSFISSSDLVHFPADALRKCSYGRARQWYTVAETHLWYQSGIKLFNLKNVAFTLRFLSFLYHIFHNRYNCYSFYYRIISNKIIYIIILLSIIILL